MTIQTKGLSNPTKIEYAGKHLLLEFWGANNIDSIKFIENALIKAVKACHATLLKVDLHKFEPQGVSGVAVIAESHISIHTWPERSYAALDIFVCNGKDPYLALASLKRSFQPEKVVVTEVKRGISS
jgi:S-adenosylmethionine decarboxylase